MDVVKTDSEGHCRRYLEELTNLPDVVLIAGGDGTVSEAVTGLLRRGEKGSCSIGILPVGRTNSVGTTLFFESNKKNRVETAKGLMNSAISVVRGKTENLDVMRIEVLPNMGDIPGKPIYALGLLQWGAFRDAFNLRDKYWYTGSLRDYVTFLMNAFSSKLTWNCDANITYSPPCTGCSNCYFQEQIPQQKTQTKRWWSTFIPLQKSSGINQPEKIDYSKISNVHCSSKFEIGVAPSNLIVATNNINKTDELSEHKLKLELGNENLTSFNFISESFSQINTNTFKSEKVIEVRTIEIIPRNVHSDTNEVFFSIDNEAFEVKPVKISLVPGAIRVFTL